MADYTYTISIDALYWQAQENGLSFAIKNSPNHSKIKEPDLPYDPGFKLSFGYHLAHDSWTWLTTFTHFHTRTTDTTTGNLFPVWSNPQEHLNFVEDASMGWRLHLGFLDTQLQKPWWISPHFFLDLVIGLEYAEIRQKTRILYHGGSLPSGSEDDISMKNKFWGFGPLTGVNLTWLWTDHFSFYAKAALSALAGFFYVHQDEDIAGENHLKLFDCFVLPRLHFETCLGLKYSYQSTRTEWGLLLGWESHFLNGQNQWIRFLDTSSPGIFIHQLGDLVIQGLVIEGSVKF